MFTPSFIKVHNNRKQRSPKFGLQTTSFFLFCEVLKSELNNRKYKILNSCNLKSDIYYRKLNFLSSTYLDVKAQKR